MRVFNWGLVCVGVLLTLLSATASGRGVVSDPAAAVVNGTQAPLKTVANMLDRPSTEINRFASRIAAGGSRLVPPFTCRRVLDKAMNRAALIPIARLPATENIQMFTFRKSRMTRPITKEIAAIPRQMAAISANRRQNGRSFATEI